MEQRYTVELTSEEITEVVAALHLREIAIKESLRLMAQRQLFSGAEEQQRRLLVCQRAANRIRIVDKQ